MEIQVKIERLLEPSRFTRKDGSPCCRYSFIGVTLDQYPKTICFDVLGDDVKFASFGIVVGGVYNVSFDLSSREYNGKWYTGVTAWKVVNVQQQQQQQQQVAVNPFYGQQQQQQMVQQQMVQPQFVQPNVVPNVVPNGSGVQQGYQQHGANTNEQLPF